MLENIYRYRTTLGYGKIKGTIQSRKEVRLSLISSTLTTVVVFLPFIFVDGMLIQMMKDLAYAIVFSLTMSIVTAMTVVPMLAGNYVNNMHRNTVPKPFGFVNELLSLFDICIKKLDFVYGRFLKGGKTQKDCSCGSSCRLYRLCMPCSFHRNGAYAVNRRRNIFGYGKST